LRTNPTECRLRARECQRLAESASSEEVRDTFSKFARIWDGLAEELVVTETMLQTWGCSSLSDRSSDLARSDE